MGAFLKERLRKSLILFCAIFYAVFSSLTYPIHEAKAGPVVGAVPAGITVGAGVYVTAALIAAGGAGLVGYDEYSDEIKTHAYNTWNSSTKLAKDSLNISLNAATGLGNGLVSLEKPFMDFVSTKLNDISEIAASLFSNTRSDISSDYVLGGYKLSVREAAGTYYLSLPTTADQNGEIMLMGGLWTSIGVSQYSGEYRVWRNGTFVNSVESWKNPDLYNAISAKGISTVQGLVNALSLLGYAPAVSNRQLYEEALAKTVPRVKEQWESMRDAGLVLPVDSAIPHANGKQAIYNPSSGAYTGIDGGVFNPSDITWSFPVPKYRDKDVPVPGVYVDTPPLTGVPSIDESIAKNPSIPKETTNVNTGVTINNPDLPIEGNPTIPGNPSIIVPPFDAPGTTGLDFTPLMMTGETMTNKFPFSIPFDFVGQLSVLNVEPQAPSFDVNVPEFLKLGSMVIPFKMKLSFEMFDPVANIIRWGMIIIFDISLIFAIRKLLPE